MANYADSLLVTAQSMLNDDMAKPEYRHKDYSIIRVLTGNAPVLLPELDSIYKSDSMTVESYCLALSASDAITARAHDHAASAFGDSQKVTLSFAIRGQEFKSSLKAADRNYIGEAQMLKGRIMGAFIHLFDTIEALAATSLNTNKSQVNDATDGERGTWDDSNYVWEIDNANQDFVFQYISSMMRENNYTNLDFIADPTLYALAMQKANQGGSNAVNLGWQFAGLNMFESPSITPGDEQIGLGYAIPKGTSALVHRIPSLNKVGKDTKDYTYTSMMDPFGLGIECAVHVREVGTDTSGSVGETQDVVFEYELTLDFAFVNAPLTTSNAATVFKHALRS